MTIALDARLVSRQNTGDTSYWRGLVNGLREVSSGHRFLLCSNSPRPAWVPESADFEWVEVPGGSDRLWSLVRFPLAARRLGAKVMHSQYNVSPLASGRGVTTIHDVSFFVQPNWYSAKDGLILRKMLPGSVRRAAHVLTVSETSRREIEQYIPQAKGKTTVTYNALAEDFSPPPKVQAQAQVRDLFGVEGDYLFMIGSAWARKNTAFGVEVSNRLAHDVNHQLLIAGKPGEIKLQSHQRSIGYVGSEAIASLYAGASGFLLPSLHEGFGIPLLEAFASGCPVFAGPGGAIPEIAGGAAVLLPDWEPQTWVASVRSALTDSGKLDAVRLLGLERVKDFSWKETARRTIQVYEGVAS